MSTLAGFMSAQRDTRQSVGSGRVASARTEMHDFRLVQVREAGRDVERHAHRQLPPRARRPAAAAAAAAAGR